MIVDAHQHFWSIGGPGQVWPGPGLPAIHRDFGPDDLRTAAGGRLAATVLVQSQADDRDTDWLLAVAAAEPLVAAVVGWADLADPAAPERIAALANRHKLKGLRPMLPSLDDDWLLRGDLAPAIAAMIDHGLRFDALVEPRHLPVLARFAARWPALAIVVDHGGKPPAASGGLDPWRDDIAALAALPNVHCKLSGLRTEQRPGQAASDLQPYVDHLLATFGDRLMWGSDWPVLLDTGDTYADWLATAQALVDPADETARAWLFGGAAQRFYGL